MKFIKNILFLFLPVLIALSWFSLAFANSAVKKFDLNKDGKIDRIEYYQGKTLVRLEEDRNYDQKMDYIEIYDHSSFYLIIQQDTNHDGKIDFKKSYSKHSLKRSKVHVEMDRNFDGKFEATIVEIVDDHQKSSECGELSMQDEIERFANGAVGIAQKIPGGFSSSGFGIKIENDCFSKWGNDFKDLVKSSVDIGMQCLDKLAKESPSRMTGALRNSFELSEILKEDKISLVCSDSDKDYDWSSTAAHASTAPSDKLKGKDIGHPFIALNPSYPKSSGNQRAKENQNIQNTIFHEMLHNLGYRHSESIEFSYGCGTCCFDKEISTSGKDAACKICAGDYVNELDPNYLSDFVQYGKESYNEKFAFNAVIKSAKLQPQDLSSAALLAEAASGVFNPLGPELAKIIEANHAQKIDSKMQSRLASAKTYEAEDDFKISQKTNTILAKSLYELYFNHDGAKSIENLKQNKDLIKREIAALEKKGGNSVWIAEELRNGLDKLIYEMWINEFPNSRISSDAYDLELFFEKK